MKKVLFETKYDYLKFIEYLNENNNILEPKSYPCILCYYWVPWTGDDFGNEYVYDYIYKNSFDTLKRYGIE